MNRNIKTLFILTLSMSLFFITGCDFRDECYDCHDMYYLDTPYNVKTTTYDNRIQITWSSNYYTEFDRYRIYRSTRRNNGFHIIAETFSPVYNDYDVTNGITYYYAISSVDWDGYEGYLSYIVYDTPRPEGFGLILYPIETNPEDAGLDFSEFLIVPWDDPHCDVFLSYNPEYDEFYLEVGNDNIDIMYWGNSSALTDVDSVPLSGWDPDGWYPVYDESSYIIWTEDNHFAHIRITGIFSDFVRMDWAYQLDSGNPELMIRNKNYISKDEIISTHYNTKKEYNQNLRSER